MKTDSSKAQLGQGIEEALGQLLQVEVILGNIPKAPGFVSDQLVKVNNRSFFASEQPITEALAEQLFEKIVKKMAEEGCDLKTIETAVNERVRYEESPPYCNQAEILEALNN